MSKFQKFKAWLKRNWKWLVAVIGIFIAIVFVFIFFRDKKLIEKLLIKARLYKAEKDIAFLEGQKVMVEKDINKTDLDIKIINDKLDDLKEEAKANVEKIKKMSPDEKLERFEKLGY